MINDGTSLTKSTIDLPMEWRQFDRMKFDSTGVHAFE